VGARGAGYHAKQEDAKRQPCHPFSKGEGGFPIFYHGNPAPGRAFLSSPRQDQEGLSATRSEKGAALRLGELACRRSGGEEGRQIGARMKVDRPAYGPSEEKEKRGRLSSWKKVPGEEINIGAHMFDLGVEPIRHSCGAKGGEPAICILPARLSLSGSRRFRCRAAKRKERRGDRLAMAHSSKFFL